MPKSPSSAKPAVKSSAGRSANQSANQSPDLSAKRSDKPVKKRSADEAAAPAPAAAMPARVEMAAVRVAKPAVEAPVPVPVPAPEPAVSPGDKDIAMRRLPSQERGRLTMDAVLRAAGSEIEQGGLDRLTTKRIAAAAGLSVGAVYGYFPNKESIVQELVARWMARVFDAVDSVHPRHGGGRDMLSFLRDQVDAVSLVYEDQPGLGALFDMLSSMPALRDISQQHETRVLQSLSTALAFYAPKADADDIAATAITIPIISHGMLGAALVYRLGDRRRMLTHLQVCLMAVASRLML